jgi:hypothetical protein
MLNADGNIGALNSDMRIAATQALNADRAACRTHAERYSWQTCAQIFLSHLVPLTRAHPAVVAR